MRVTFFIFVIIHGLLHSLGFLKAYQISEIKDLILPISRPMGMFWLLAGLLFLITAVLFILGSPYWWLAGLVAGISSQVLTIMFWQDAKFATLPNLIILLVCLLSYGSFRFDGMVHHETKLLLAQQESTIFKERTPLDSLPLPVRRWLEKSGALRQNIPLHVLVKQDLEMRLDPEQEGWYPATATQQFTLDPPGFIWQVDVQMNPFIHFAGRDKYFSGEGEMLIKIFSLLPVVDEKSNPRIDESTMQRYLAELCWFPAAAFGSHIQWEEIDSLSARATMTYGDITSSGVYYFSEGGDVQRFTCLRYREVIEGAEKLEWTADILQTEEHNGVRVPTVMQASWRLPEGDWTWLKLNVTEIEYNP